MITEVPAASKFQVKVGGLNIEAPQLTQRLAELVVMRLPPEKQLIAEIVVVTEDRKQMLLG